MSQPVLRNVYDSGLVMGWHHTLSAANNDVSKTWGTRTAILLIAHGQASTLDPRSLTQATLDQVVQMMYATSMLKGKR